MNKSNKIIGTVIGTLGLVYAGQAVLHERALRMNQVPLAEMALKPKAFGRFLVDLPRGVEMAKWRQGYKGTGPITVSEQIGTREFETIVEQRIEELKAVPHQEGGTLFEQMDNLALPNAKQVLYWDSELSKLQLECDAYYSLGNRLFKINPSTDPDQQSKMEMQAANEEILGSLRLRHPDEVPTVPGFCFQGGIITRDISDRLTWHTERIMVDIEWKERPDVHLSLYAIGNGDRLDPPLLHRLKEAGSDRDDKVLRSGPRVVGPFRGEEHLTRVREKNGTEGHLFVWESQGTFNDPFNPQLRVDMTTGDGPGGAENASLSDKDAMKLWDAIIGSLRVRPTTQTTGKGTSGTTSQGTRSTPTPAAPPKPRAALGTSLRSGEKCTQTGTWACGHQGRLGGERHAFREGETLPEAVLDTNRGLLGKLMGRPAEVVVETAWTLVGYPDEG